MKKSTKIWLIVAGVMLAVGMVMVAIGWRSGRYSVVNWAANGDLSIGPFFDWDFDDWDLHIDSDEVALDNIHERYSGDVSDTVITESAKVKRLTIGVGGGVVYLTESADDQYHISSENASEFQCYAENGDLQLSSPKVNVNGNCRIYLAVPAGQAFNSISISIGGGVLTADTLTADEVDIDLGAGKVTVDALAAEKLSMYIGAGKAELAGGEVKDAYISVGMGTVGYNGSITGDLSADCAMGEMNFNLAGEEKDHNYDVECAMGEVQIGDSHMNGIGSEKVFDNGADSSFTLSCSMGSLKVRF